MEFKIKEDLLRAILVYLQEQPYKDVSGLINAIQSQCTRIEKIQETKQTVVNNKTDNEINEDNNPKE